MGLTKVSPSAYRRAANFSGNVVALLAQLKCRGLRLLKNIAIIQMYANFFAHLDAHLENKIKTICAHSISNILFYSS